MKLGLKLFLIAFILAVLFAGLFARWGSWFETVMDHEACLAWFEEIRPYAWAVGMGLLVSDLLLPVPATGVMTALGAVYGTAWGTLIGAAGSCLAGVTGFVLARKLGKRGTRLLADPEELERCQHLFDRWGGLAIIVSRITPILPEVLSILAGLAGMRTGRFLTALVLGTVPTALLFARMGSLARDMPEFGMALALGVPVVIYAVLFLVMRRK